MKEEPTISKVEAAERLDVTTKTIERLASAGKLQKIERPGKRGTEVFFIKSEVEALRKERESGMPAPRIVRQERTDNDRQDKMEEILKIIAATVLKPERPMLTDGTQDKTRHAPTVSIESKAFLTIPEAVALSGLGRAQIETAITSNKLKAKSMKGTRGRRIKRADLDAYINKL